MAAQPIERTSIPAALSDALRRRILRGEIGEGEQLRQETIAAEYDVSRMPVREALRQLEAEGLVRFSPHKGAVVTSLSPSEIEEVFDLRALIEPDLLRRAIPHLSAADLETAAENAKAFDDALRDAGPDVAEIGRYNWALHAALYAPAGRTRTMQFLQTLHYQAERYTRLQVILTHGEQRASADHRNLIEYCRRREAEAACDLLRRHIEDAGRDLLDYLEKQRG
ncbi:MAG: GntR family transcriptional regulator [Rhodovibrionaceae bacterium]|nr:GntR family transcriptional regulator [Rhodovibrionaceae bacterium]